MNIRDTNNFDSTNMSSMRVSKKIDISRISRKGIDPGAVTYMTPDVSFFAFKLTVNFIY